MTPSPWLDTNGRTSGVYSKIQVREYALVRQVAISVNETSKHHFFCTISRLPANNSVRLHPCANRGADSVQMIAHYENSRVPR